jgi:putative peptidoglycan lipid II flippase
LGLIRDIFIARYLSTDLRDAFLNAFRLPNLFRRILGEGSLSVSFIPVFVRTLQDPSDPQHQLRARQLVAGVFSILLSIAITVTLLAEVYMEELMHFLLNGAVYMSVPGKFEMTVRLGRIMFGFLILISLYGYFMAILNSLRKFALTALAPCLFNVAMIAGALSSTRFVVPELILAVSVLVGGFFQMAILLIPVWRLGYPPRFTFSWNSPEILKVFKALIPSAFGLSILQVTALVNMRFAASLPSGSHSYLYLADRILELPISLFVVSIGAALLPTLSRLWAANQKQAVSDTLNHYMRLIIFVALPAAIGMFMLAQPITEVLFLGREFKYDSAVATAEVIRIYAFLVVLTAGVRILAQGFYAIQNAWFPAIAASVALFAHIVFAFVLTRAFGLNGLAVASVASAAVNVTMLATAYNSWVGKLELKRLGLSLVKFAVCSIFLVLVLSAYPWLRVTLTGHFPGARAVALGIIIFSAGAVYMLAAHLLRVPEYHETLSTFREKMRRA